MYTQTPRNGGHGARIVDLAGDSANHTPTTPTPQPAGNSIRDAALEIQRRAGMLSAVSFGIDQAVDGLNVTTDSERHALDRVIYLLAIADDLIVIIGAEAEKLEIAGSRLNREAQA